ncbi:SAM-dependent methyltransferase [Corallococcus exercitus]|uniref:SAM-dependent methyltransferase n=1 Tax=Corallococcus exercitus TaxID=2316736 RepID=A0A7Y4KR02_9BACT|nr:SAM-dependent methyltransferase [Corallococcus exercitus]NOK38372.1 SAM-dependent methyltransferase [Corallococcus exercitus]
MTDGRSGTAGAKRTVYCEDALAWLEARPVLDGCSVVASLPDVSEFPSLTVPQWKDWFVGAAAKVLSRVPQDGVAVFYQSDVKKDGVWVDKGYLVSKAAEAAGCDTLWHKVVCRRTPGTVTFGRPAYSHLLCFSRGLKADAAKSTADVLPDPGEVTWTRGMGLNACLVACRFILEQTRTRTVVDPFCGHGTALAVANALGLDAVGVELSRKRARRARNLQATWTGGKLELSSMAGDGEEPSPDGA